MIEDWREVFMADDLPFIFCQLPRFEMPGTEDFVTWPKLREQQKIVSETVPGIYMADIYECGETGNIHPSDKKTPGTALAVLALKYTL